MKISIWLVYLENITPFIVAFSQIYLLRLSTQIVSNHLKGSKMAVG